MVIKHLSVNFGLTSSIRLLTVTSIILAAPIASAVNLDLTSITLGSGGNFTGSLDGVSVTGSITGASQFQVNGLGSNFNDITRAHEARLF